MSTTIVWFRLDLRIADNPALAAAAQRGAPILPVYIWSPDEEGDWAPGAASRFWLHQSLASLDKSLRTLGSKLILRSGAALETLAQAVRESGAGAVYWNRRYEPAAVARDAQIKQTLREMGIEAESFNSALLYEPWEIQNKHGKPFQVFTPFWKACSISAKPNEPVAPPRSLGTPKNWPACEPLEALKLEPTINWTGGIRDAWTPGEHGAQKQLNRFLDEVVHGYADGRDRPDTEGTSRLSPHLHFGEIGPRQIQSAVRECALHRQETGIVRGEESFLRELGWREFAHHLLYHFPETASRPLRDSFARFPWREDEAALRAWQRGRTGYPVVDAGMRELWHTGWMHNRVRMIVASFLTKDLTIAWLDGAHWFWDTLVDADLANNTLGWQWTAGCGADAAPYFRIFNPVSQGKKFDPHGNYVRRFVPELARLPDKWIHCPWEAPPDVLSNADIRLGIDYPLPIVNHAKARARALEAFHSIRE